MTTLIDLLRENQDLGLDASEPGNLSPFHNLKLILKDMPGVSKSNSLGPPVLCGIEFRGLAHGYCSSSKLCGTPRGYLGVVPIDIKVGDKVAILHNCQV